MYAKLHGIKEIICSFPPLRLQIIHLEGSPVPISAAGNSLLLVPTL
jgi:hypothetical protein